MNLARCSLASLFFLIVACTQESAPEVTPAAPAFDRVERAAFNRNAMELMLPLFWFEDSKSPGILDADELAIVWGIDDSKRGEWINGSGLTVRFGVAYERIVTRAAAPAPVDTRLAALEKELDQGRFTLAATDVSAIPPGEKKAIEHILAAARIVDQLFTMQVGGTELRGQIPADDSVSRLAFYLNHGPWCSAPQTESDTNCNAVASRPKRRSGLYPMGLQEDADFCEKLSARDDAKALFDQFSVVVEGADGKLEAVPYSVVYADPMKKAAVELRAAAAALGDDEAAFQAYLLAAARAFEDNDWFAADEAWAAMTATNSKYYLRIGPDETYFEPCSRKAGFHVSFARINPDSIAWQQKLDPVKNEMEKVLAKMAGAPYEARKVTFQLPDFIDIIVNAGDSRSPRGGTAGQSLPNWGPVAADNRGRTVVMTNLFHDPDSNETTRKQVASMFCAESVGLYKQNHEAGVFSTVLHEAAHNLGPAHEYAVKGKTDDEIFGGPHASLLEELKAQTAAFYFALWLEKKGLVTTEMATQANVSDIVWGMSHVSRGLFDADGKPKPYAQLAGLQLAQMMKHGVLTWHADKTAANGSDRGCAALDLAGMEKAMDELLQRVAGIKASGDKKGADTLIAEVSDEKAPWQPLFAAATERWRRYPRASLLYSVRF